MLISFYALAKLRSARNLWFRACSFLQNESFVWFGQDNYLAIFSFTVLKVSSLINSFRIFQGCFTVQLSMFSVLLTRYLSSSNFDIIPDVFQFVNNFFKVFSEVFDSWFQNQFSSVVSLVFCLCFAVSPQQRVRWYHCILVLSTTFLKKFSHYTFLKKFSHA